MDEKIDENILDWFRQYVCDSDNHVDPNVFLAHPEDDIREFECEFGEVLPDSYLKFLRQIGAGRLTKDINGIETLDYKNYFMRTSDIADVLRKETIDWKIYPDFIAADETPFFDLGNNSVLVFRLGCGSAVYHPYLDEVYANSFEEFLQKLMANVTFYNEITHPSGNSE